MKPILTDIIIFCPVLKEKVTIPEKDFYISAWGHEGEIISDYGYNISIDCKCKKKHRI